MLKREKLEGIVDKLFNEFMGFWGKYKYQNEAIYTILEMLVDRLYHKILNYIKYYERGVYKLANFEIYNCIEDLILIGQGFVYLLSDNGEFKDEKMAEDIVETLIKKNIDYGDSFEKVLLKTTDSNMVARLYDKLFRLQHLCKNKALINESSYDTIKDGIGYTILCINYLNGKMNEIK